MSVTSLQWSDLQLLRFVSQSGTAAAAARVLNVDQTTVSRRLAQIETSVGARLFDRIDRRLVPTSALLAALGELDRMADAAELANNAMRSAQSQLSGTVSVSGVDPVISWILAPRVGDLARSHPNVTLELDVDNRNVSLARREADVALRLGRPDADEALIRRLGVVRYCLVGPAYAQDASALPLAGHTDDLAFLPEARWLMEQFPGVKPALRANSLKARVEAAASGFCTVVPRFVLAADPRLMELSSSQDGPTRELWRMVHPDRRHDAAVVAVVAWIETAVREKM